MSSRVHGDARRSLWAHILSDRLSAYCMSCRITLPLRLKADRLEDGVESCQYRSLHSSSSTRNQTASRILQRCFPCAAKDHWSARWTAISRNHTQRGILQLITGLYEASNNSANPENTFSTVLPHLSSLESHIETCAKDVTAWVRVTKDSDPSSEKGIRAFLKKLKVAVDKSSFEEIERKIADHKVRVGLSLSVLGMYVTNYIEVKVTSR